MGYQILKLACRHIGESGFRLDALRFSPGRKPYMHDGVQFNLSHSHQLVACAISRRTTVGLDTEYVRPVDGERLANTLTEAERRAAGSDSCAFFHCWTRKEAVIKADGNAGLQHMLEIETGSTAADGAISFRGKQWHLAELRLDASYVTYLSTSQRNLPVVQQKIDLSRLC